MAYANGIDQGPRSWVSRVPKRIAITVPYSTFRQLEQRSAAEGRSLSNLAAYALERELQRSEQA